MNKYPTLICVSLSIIASAAQDSKPAASELLDQFAKTIDCFDSFRIVSKSKIDIGLLGEKYKTLTMIETYCYEKETKRYSERIHKWGQYPFGEKSIPEDNAWYSSRIKIDGKHTRTCTIPGLNAKDPGYGRINTSARSTQFEQGDMPQRCIVGPIMGYLTMANPERIDRLLREANTLSVRDSVEEVAGSLCYVIEAATDHGRQRLWIDPDHGYNIARAEIEDLLRSGSRHKVCVKNVKFKQVDGVWTTIAFEKERHDINDSGVRVENTYCTILESSINPDHETLRSFDFDDIREGAQVKVIGNQREQSPIKYIWRDGKPVPDISEDVAQLNAIAKELILKDEVPEDLKTAKTEVIKLLIQYGISQDRLRSFIEKAKARITDTTSQDTMKMQTITFAIHERQFKLMWHFDETIKPCYQSIFSDGDRLVHFTTMDDSQNNKVLLTRSFKARTEALAKHYRGAPLIGILAGDSERIDKVLSKTAKALKFAGDEAINGIACRIVKAATGIGVYTLWIAPEMDCHIVKAEFFGTDNSAIASFAMNNVVFKKVDGFHVPFSADIEITSKNANDSAKCHYQRTMFELNPDHAARKSFDICDIPDGTQVKRTSPPESRFIRFIWKDGKAVRKGGYDDKVPI